LPFSGLALVDGLMCIDVHKKDWLLNRDDLLQQAFSACSIPPTPILADDRRLFYCNKSMKLISKHRVQDSTSDCYHMEDAFVPKYIRGAEYVLNDEDASIMRHLNLTGRFKCNTTDQWLPRSAIGYDDGCGDKSDTLYTGSCKIASDSACQFLRGLYSPPVFYAFQENCNSILKLRFHVDNETDETNCEEWPGIRCNGHWNLIDGEDELNCSNTISLYITHTVLKCDVNEHYCADISNGTMGCLAKERAGDGIVDCSGRTDERMTSCAFQNP
jgi:hypothetical protein